MKRVLYIAIAVLLLAALAGTASAGVMVTSYLVTPDVLSPGEEGLLTVTIANGGASAAANASAGDSTIESVRLHSTDLSVLSGDYDGIGLLSPGQSIPITFHFRAPSAPGIYFPEVWIRTAAGQTVRYPVVVNVGTPIGQLVKPALALEKDVPAAVAPGDTFTVTLSVVNYGSAPAADVLLTVNGSAQSLGIAGPGTDYLARLDPGESHPVAFAFSTDKKATLGLRTIGATLDYVLPDGTARRQNESFSVLVRGRATLGLASLTTDPVRVEQGQAFTLLARLENTGTDNAKSARVRIDLPFSGNNESFIGTIEPGNDAPAVFNLVADEAGVRPYTLSASYTDDEGTHTINESLTLEVAQSSGNATVLAVAAIVVIVLAAAGIWYWRRRSA